MPLVWSTVAVTFQRPTNELESSRRSRNHVPSAILAAVYSSVAPSVGRSKWIVVVPGSPKSVYESKNWTSSPIRYVSRSTRPPGSVGQPPAATTAGAANGSTSAASRANRRMRHLAWELIRRTDPNRAVHPFYGRLDSSPPESALLALKHHDPIREPIARRGPKTRCRAEPRADVSPAAAGLIGRTTGRPGALFVSSVIDVRCTTREMATRRRLGSRRSVASRSEHQWHLPRHSPVADQPQAAGQPAPDVQLRPRDRRPRPRPTPTSPSRSGWKACARLTVQAVPDRRKMGRALGVRAVHSSCRETRSVWAQPRKPAHCLRHGRCIPYHDCRPEAIGESPGSHMDLSSSPAHVAPKSPEVSPIGRTDSRPDRPDRRGRPRA